MAPLHGDSLEEGVLACATRAQPGNGADGGTGHMGAHAVPEGHKPARESTARVQASGLAKPARMWQWSLPRTGTVVHLVHSPKEYVEHLFRELLRETQPAELEKRRPRTFGGMGARLERTLTLSDIATCDTQLDKSLLRGVLAGAIWTADRAHQRGLRPDNRCPYCPQGVRDDEEHLLWWCAAWKAVRDPFLPDGMLLARALRLGSLTECPPCVRLCGMMPESVVIRSGQARGLGWEKRCRELNRTSRHRMPGPGEDYHEARRQRDELALAGQKWVEDDSNPLEQLIHKLHGMFRAVLRARMRQEEEMNLLFPV